MYKIEILTDVGSFIATMPEEINEKIDIMDAVEWVDKQITEGRGLELDDCTVLRIKNTAHIVGLRAFRESTAVEESTGHKSAEPEEGNTSPMPPWQGATGSIHVWKEKVSYTGTQYTIVVLSTWDADSRAYFLLFTINGAAARDIISDRGQAKMVAAWLEQNYGGYKGQYEVIVPHGTIFDREEAETYLKDYVRETAPEHKPTEKTGKAWRGWNEDRGRG